MQGCTAPYLGQVYGSGLLPTGTGMHLGRRSASTTRCALSCTYRDAPARRSFVASFARSFPHVQGCTYDGVTDPLIPGLLPARTGVYLRSRSAPAPRTSTSRMYGDAPAIERRTSPRLTSFPHVRGCTFEPEQDPLIRRLFPAPMGCTHHGGRLSAAGALFPAPTGMHLRERR